MERVTGIEPALSAWESDRSGPLTTLTWATDAPLVTVIHPMTPGLMARQWPMVYRPADRPESGHSSAGSCHRRVFPHPEQDSWWKQNQNGWSFGAQLAHPHVGCQPYTRRILISG
jgi:hypothetical protein